MSTPGHPTAAPCRVGIFMTHPVQYHAPLWRALAQDAAFDVTVHYFSDQGVNAAPDPGFGQAVAWDVPLLDGYRHVFLTREPIAREARFAIPEAAAFWRAARFDAVLIHGYTHAFARQIARRRPGAGWRLLLRGEFSDRPRAGVSALRRLVREMYLRWFYARVDHFCPIGVESTRHLERRGIPPARMTLTPYSVDDRQLERSRAGLDRAACRAALGIPADATVFMFSGKLIPRKRPLLLAEAAARLRADPRLFLLYVGQGGQSAVLAAALNAALPGRHLLAGFVNQTQLARYFVAADVLVLPSEFETWGLVANEAMHHGLPVVVGEGVGCREDLVIPGRTGFVFEGGDPAALAAELARFLAAPELAAGMGRAAREHIRNYTLDRTVAGLASAIRKAVAR